MDQKSNPSVSFISQEEKSVNPCVKLVNDVWLSEPKNRNLVFSPLSIHTVLGKLASGATGETLKQLLQFLNCESLNTLNSRVSQLIVHKTQITGRSGTQSVGDGGTVISSSLKDSFLEALVWHEEVDLKIKENEEKMKEWNTRAAKESYGLIEDLLPADAFNTVSPLENFLRLEVSWNRYQFEPSLTETSKFYLLDGKQSSVDVSYMSSERDRFRYISCYDSFKVLKLPYKRNRKIMYPRYSCPHYSMYIVLPERRNGLGELVEKLSSDPAVFLDHYLPSCHPWVPTKEFKIPKFRIRFDFEAKPVLQKLGLVLPFDESNAELIGSPNPEGFYAYRDKTYVDKVYHKCFVEVDEDGTKTTASTYVIEAEEEDDDVCYPSIPGHPPVDFVADHPFMFIIREERSRAVVFMGLVVNPLL